MKSGTALVTAAAGVASMTSNAIGGATVTTNGSTTTMTPGNGLGGIAVGNTQSSMLVRNTTTGINHGLTVGQTNAVLTGGTHSTIDTG